ncbi:hypothetical protein O1M54_07985 [Streptomyces diastatochromogenes]|nr:hypothetical protein [Streptomyces diastatochromogenes]
MRAGEGEVVGDEETDTAGPPCASLIRSRAAASVAGPGPVLSGRRTAAVTPAPA